MNTIDPITEEMLKNILRAREDRIKGLERQIEALKEYIKQQTGIDVTNAHLGIDEEEIPFTKTELGLMEYHSRLLEKHSDMFAYGRIGKERMAESL